MVTLVDVEHGWYHIDEDGKFHSDPYYVPAIHINNYIETSLGPKTLDENGNEVQELIETPVNGYTAWYEHGELVSSERNPE